MTTETTTRPTEAAYIYFAWGRVRGRCQHDHRTAAAADRCAERDRRDCESMTGGAYSDRTVYRHTEPGEWRGARRVTLGQDAAGRVIDATDEPAVACECGEWSGEPCEWSGPKSETVRVEWMPDQHRASHEAAGGCGLYPHNGSIRSRVHRDCAERMIEIDGEWCRIR